MKRLASSLLALPLLLALAAPAAAVEPTPEPVLYGEMPACPPVEIVDGVYVIPKDAPADCMYLQGGGVAGGKLIPVPPPSVVLAPDEFAPCDVEVVAAAETETPLAVATPCLFPDGTLYGLARGTTPTERGEAIPDFETLYTDWMTEFKKGLEPCAEGTDPADMSVMTCLLPDGTIAGPIPLMAAAPGALDDTGAIDAGAASDTNSPLPLALLVGVAAAGGLLIARRRRAV